MTGDIPSETHSFSTKPQRIVQDGLELFHSHCQVCGRDFVRTGATRHWNAAQHRGFFSIDVLPHEISERWLSEPCPGERCESDEVDRLFAENRREV